MKKAIILLIMLSLIMLELPNGHAASPTINPPLTGTQRFFDDFIQSQFPDQWNGATLPQLNNSTQTNGYLVTSLPRNAILTFTAFTQRLIGNNIGTPVAQGGRSSFTQIIYKVQPFNLTQLAVVSQASGSPSSTRVIADLQIGLERTISGGFNSDPDHAVYFELMASSSQLSTFRVGGGLPAQKQAVWLDMNAPGGAPAAVTFHPNLLTATGTQNATLYNGGNAPIDLNSQHIFTIQYNINITDSTRSYARFQVDNNGWMIYWDTACNCIGTTSSDLYPFMALSVIVDAPGPVPPYILSQTIASQMDFVVVTDYALTTLPTGQLLSSNINPPLKNQGIYQPGGFSLTQYVQFEANNMGQGNIYAGGLFLTGIFLLIITLGLAGVMWKTRMGFSVFGMIWNISTLAFIYLMFYCGVIPLVIPVLVTIGAAAILFGIFRSGPPSMGGEVAS